MKPEQFQAIYNYLLQDAASNSSHKIYGLKQMGTMGAIEAILYLPVYSSGKKAHVMTPRIDRLKFEARKNDCEIDFFVDHSLEKLEELCNENVFSDFFCLIYEIRKRAKRIKELGAGAIEQQLNVPNQFPDLEYFRKVMKLLTQFRGVADVAAQHILMELGWPIVKPDRHIQRVLHRVGGWSDFFSNNRDDHKLNLETLYKFQKKWNFMVNEINNYGLSMQSVDPNVPSLNELNSRMIDACLMWFCQSQGRDDAKFLGKPLCTLKPECVICPVRECEFGKQRKVT
jgi:endonuclease III